MEETVRDVYKNLWSADGALQNKAFLTILELTEHPVAWAYEVWDELLANLHHPDNHNRAIASQVLCNLARSDPQERMLTDFPALLEVTRDERFVTARHCLLALWKVGTVSNQHLAMVTEGLAARFRECETEKNCTLICYDIIQGFKNLYTVVRNEAIRTKALELIETETDIKYKKKYASLWRAS